AGGTSWSILLSSMIERAMRAKPMLRPSPVSRRTPLRAWARAGLLGAALFELGWCALSGCAPAAAPTVGPGDHVGDPCQRSTDCGDGLSCHYGGTTSQAQNVCRLEVGRCRFDRDC